MFGDRLLESQFVDCLCRFVCLVVGVDRIEIDNRLLDYFLCRCNQ